MRDLTPDEKWDNTLRDLTDDDLLVYASEAWEHLGEVEGQIGSEVSLFGDSWPGSAQELALVQDDVASIDAEIGRRGLGVE